MSDTFNPDSYLESAPEVPKTDTPSTPDQAQMDLSTSQFDPDQYITDNNLHEHAQHEQELEPFRTPSQKVLAGAEALGRGLIGPLAPAAELATGLTSAENIRKREEANNITSAAGEIAGFLAPSSVIGKAGEAATGLAKAAGYAQSELIQKGVAKALEHLPAVNSLAGKVGKDAAKLAVESVLFTGSDELSKAVLKDPEQSAASVAAHLGAAGLLGLGLGSAASIVGHTADKVAGSKAVQFMEDFKGRVHEHLENPNPVESFTKQLDDHYKNIKELSDDVYGPNGLKEQDIKLAVPKSPELPSQQAQSIKGSLDQVLDSMHQDTYAFPPRLTNKLQRDVDQFASKLDSDSSEEIFTALQDLKHKMQGYSKFDKSIAPHAEEYDFVHSAKNLYDGLRNALEDEDVWGKAATRQKSINKAFSDYLPKLEDFEKKFTTTVDKEKILDPDKINSFFAQLGGTKSEIKKQILDNFMKASDKYRGVIEETHSNLGLTPPNVATPTNAIQRVFKKSTSGEKAADWLLDKGLSKHAGDIAGAAIGGTLAHQEHIPGAELLGAALGHSFISPILNSVFPTIAKKLLSNPSVLSGLAASAKVLEATLKGESLINKAAKGIFIEGSRKIVPFESDEKMDKLDKKVQKLSMDPEKLINGQDHVSTYLPEVATSINETNGRVVTYLASQRPKTSAAGPLDETGTVNQAEKTAYKSTLTIALNPTVVLDKVREGTITPKDLADLVAMYPALHKNMANKIVTQITKMKNPSKIPFSVKTGLSVFMGQPMTGSFTPAQIMSAQGVFGRLAPRNNAIAVKQPGRPSAPALQKISDNYTTPNQSLMKRKDKS